MSPITDQPVPPDSEEVLSFRVTKTTPHRHRNTPATFSGVMVSTPAKYENKRVKTLERLLIMVELEIVVHSSE